MNEIPSDNVETDTESEAFGVWDKLTWNPQTRAFENIWINYYHTISQCNTVLSRIDGVSFTNAAVKAQYISEMKFIRALMYFEWVRRFGEVPLLLELVTSDKKPDSYLRKPVDEIYTQIEKDLMEAITPIDEPAGGFDPATRQLYPAQHWNRYEWVVRGEIATLTVGERLVWLSAHLKLKPGEIGIAPPAKGVKYRAITIGPLP